MGSNHHRDGCGCPFCVGGGHKQDCECSFHSSRSTIRFHKPGCQCSFHRPGGKENHRDDCTCAWCAGHPGTSDTVIELIMQELLTQLCIEFETQARFGRYRVDIYIPDVGLVIECDGEVWHQDKQYQRRRDSYLRRQGLSVWHFRGSLIVDDPMPRLNRALQAVS